MGGEHRRVARSVAALAVAATILAGGISPAAASAGSSSVDAPRIRAAVPEFLFPYSPFLVDVAFEVTCAQYCPGYVEVGVALNELPLPAETPEQALTGIVAWSGAWADVPGPQALAVEAYARASPGLYMLQVALRPGGEENWTVSPARPYRVLSHASSDGDGVSDDLERAVCSHATLSDLAFMGGDDCHGDDLRVRGGVLMHGPIALPSFQDADADGFPDSLTIYATRVQLGPWIESVDYAPVVTTPFDTWAGKRPTEDRLSNGTDREIVTCVPLPMFTGAGWEHDVDEDGLPLYLVAAGGQACIDADDAFRATVDVGTAFTQTPVDGNDTRADEFPAPGALVHERPLHARFDVDADADGIPGASYTLLGRITTPPLSRGMMETSYAWRVTTWDAFEDDDMRPWPYTRLDSDNDRVPDASEPFVCLREDFETESDGECSSDLLDFHPPALYATSFRAPAMLADDDEDLVSDGGEAFVCDLDARWLWLGLCVGDDLRVE